MVICIRDFRSWMSDRDNDFKFELNHKYHMRVGYKGNELWYEVYDKKDLSYWIFSSIDLKECLDYCNILYY